MRMNCAGGGNWKCIIGREWWQNMRMNCAGGGNWKGITGNENDNCA
jgi:hypothetical protein